MKATLKLEELAQFILTGYLFYQLNYSWWIFPAVILVPDLGVIGYLLSPKIGAILYNLVHHKAIAIIILGFGYFTTNTSLIASGLILYSHSSMDRMMGYGLKY